MIARAGANREERDRSHAVEFGLSEVVELYERRGITHRPDHEVAPCPRLADHASGFLLQDIAILQFAATRSIAGNTLRRSSGE